MLAKSILALGVFLYLILLSGTISDLSQIRDSGGSFSLSEVVEATVFLPGAILLMHGAYFLGMKQDWRSNRFGLLALIALVPIHFVLSAVVSHGGISELLAAIIFELTVVMGSILFWHRRLKTDLGDVGTQGDTAE